MVNSNSVKTDIMEMMKVKFGTLALWQRIESDVALICAGLPEPNNNERKKEFISKLNDLKSYLIKVDVPEKDLRFINNEITLHKQTKMMSLYEEKEDEIDQKVVTGYSRLGRNTEGVVAISQPYNYIQLSKLTNRVYKNTNLVKFYISAEQTIYGKIVAEFYEGQAQDIPIAKVMKSKRTQQETGEKDIRISLFGEKNLQKTHDLMKEINLPFYVYRFITESNRDLILITMKPHEIGDYIITGVQTECDDYKMLTDSARLPTKLPFFFSQKVINKIIKFKKREDFKERLDELKINKKDYFNYPFTITKKDKTWELKQPKWYKWLIWSWLTHEAKGTFNNYPMHIMQLGVKNSGKSLQLNGLHAKSKEFRSIFSGSSSTLKHLIPSFKYKPAQLGYLAESNRFAFCDEFLRCLVNVRSGSGKNDDGRDESVAMMNDLLEHQKREAGSGVSKVNVNMTARIFATTNPVRGVNNVHDLIRSLDESFLSRWLIYYQTEDHVQLIRQSNDADLKEYFHKLKINDWVSIIDYLQTFSSNYDLKRVLEIHNSIPEILTETLGKHYDARHKHHIECLIDGIIKARCFLDGDMSFKAIDKDYEILKEVWINIIKSWVNIKDIKNAPLHDRIYYLPEKYQTFYWHLVNQKRAITNDEAKEIGLKLMDKTEFYETCSVLSEMELIKTDEKGLRPHYMDSGENNEQKIL